MFGKQKKNIQCQINIEDFDFGFANNKVVLVTGGGGFVGTKMCYKVAENGAKKLLIYELSELNANTIRERIKQDHPELDVVTLIGSTSDIDRVNDVFKTYKPDVVVHAGMYDDEALMEDSPCEAVKNVILGSYNVMRSARENAAESFILITSDKAIDPTTVLGASKKITEMMAQEMPRFTDKTTYETLRLNNATNTITKVTDKLKFNYEDVLFNLQTTVVAARANDANKTTDYLRKIVPTYSVE